MRTVIPVRDAGPYIRDRIEFKTSTRHFRGIPQNDGGYEIWSYRTLIAEFRDGVWYINDTSYSPTTSQQQWSIRHAIGEQVWKESVHVDHLYRGTYTLRENVRGKVAQERANRLARESAWNNRERAIQASRELIAQS